jgi:predicted TIM-barrel fold metal-dependent hydrolase
MRPTTNAKLAHFHRWSREAAYGATFVYHREPLERDAELFTFARKMQEAGLVFLFSRRLDDGRFEKCARRTQHTAHLVLDKLSRTIQVAPSSAHAKEHAA